MSTQNPDPAFSVPAFLMLVAVAAVYPVLILVPLIVIPLAGFVAAAIMLAVFTASVSRFALVRLVIGLGMAGVIIAGSWYVWLWANFSADEAQYVLSRGPLGLVDFLDRLADRFAYQIKDIEFTGDALRTIWWLEAGIFTLAGLVGVFWRPS